MSRLGAPSRGTPVSRTPDTEALRVASDARASHAVARALVQLVQALDALAKAPASTEQTARDAVRDALRQLTARSRDGALLCRVVDGELLLEGVPVSGRDATADAPLSVLLQRLSAIGAGALTVREGAAPGELLTLGRLLSPQSVGGDRAGSSPSDTPTTVRVFGLADDAPLELLRSWSVLVSPAATVRPDVVATTTAGVALARLAAARSDDAASLAVTALVSLLDEAQRRGDALAVEGIARGCMAQLQVVGTGGGRLAVEGGLRHLLRPPLLTLIAQRLPHSADRASLLQLMSRAGDLGVETLLEQMLNTDDPVARRAYFDGIVAMDVGSPLLFDLLNDPRWFVVRNAAALLGEMRVEHTDEALLPLLQHADDRIRIAVARALVRVRSTKALQGLHAAVEDSNAEVRRLAAAAFGIAGPSTGGMRPPAARLSLALERETDEDVALEMLAALGRLGSADAVQRLLRIALPTSPEPGSASRPPAGSAAPNSTTSSTTSSASTGTPAARSVGTRDAWQRIAALEALVRARGNAVLPAIELLQNDNDPNVAAAATRLRATVRAGVSEP